MGRARNDLMAEFGEFASAARRAVPGRLWFWFCGLLALLTLLGMVLESPHSAPSMGHERRFDFDAGAAPMAEAVMMDQAMPQKAAMRHARAAPMMMAAKAEMAFDDAGGGGGGGGGDAPPGAIPRKVQFETTLAMLVKDVAATVRELDDKTNQAGGFVVNR